MNSNVVKVDFTKRVVSGVAAPSEKLKQWLIATMKKEGYQILGQMTDKYDADGGLWQLRIPCISPYTGDHIDMTFWYHGDSPRFAYAAELGKKALLAYAQKVG